MTKFTSRQIQKILIARKALDDCKRCGLTLFGQQDYLVAYQTREYNIGKTQTIDRDYSDTDSIAGFEIITRIADCGDVGTLRFNSKDLHK
jgi:hypothetical protein